MQILSVPLTNIEVPPHRQRGEIEGEALAELMASIEAHGLLHPIVVKGGAGGKYTLVAGGRRLAAIHNHAGLGGAVRFGGSELPVGCVPCVSLGSLDPLAAEEAELEENIRRVDLTWAEKAAATARLADLRRKQAASVGSLPPTLRELSSEVRGHDDPASSEATRREIVLAAHLHKPEIAKAKTLDEAWKALKLEEQRADFAARAAAVGSPPASVHTLHQGDSFSWIKDQPAEIYDVICVDPPYGMGADGFGDAGGRLGAQTHSYADSPAIWQRVLAEMPAEWFRVAKAQAHLYLCCDIDGFHAAREALRAAGWNPHRTPIINFKRDGARLPWPKTGPQRKWELVLYAEKGGRPCTHIYPDVIETQGDQNFGHGAQKPVALYVNLLKRSVLPGDRVLDNFGGTGTILPAAHELKCKATYVEQDPVAYGIALKRLETLI